MSNKNEIKEVAQEIVGWENNRIWLTIRDLTVRPGYAIRAYCDGNPKRYLSPVTYFFAASAIVLYLTSINGQHDVAKEQFKKERVYREDRFISGKEFIEGDLGNKVMQFAFVPITLLLRWLLFRKHNNSFKANSWYSLFIQGHKYLFFGLFGSLLWFITGNSGLSSAIAVILGFFYDVWSSCEFYQIKLKTSIVLNLIFTICYFACIGVALMGVIKYFIV